MPQLLMVGGAEVHASKENFYDYLRSYSLDPNKKRKRYRERLEHSLHGIIDCFLIEMPNKRDADYYAWKIWFEKYLRYVEEGGDVRILGGSCGGAFVLKRLSENTFPTRISQLHVVAPVSSDIGLVDEIIGNFAFSFEKLGHLEEQCDQIFVYHSKDDFVVPFAQTEELIRYLPKAMFEIFENRGHFLQPAFPELLANMGVYSR